MNKKDLIARIALTTGCSQKDVDTILNSLTTVVSDALLAGDKVTLSGLGTFEVKERAARTGRNPFTQETMEIPACKVPSFKVSSTLKKTIKEQ